MQTSGQATTSIDATTTLEDAMWRRTLAVHLHGTFYCTREALKMMQARRSTGSSTRHCRHDRPRRRAGRIAFAKSCRRLRVSAST
jgi:NAD(P)-dependent dehydrogenase (short-subunit alcohol dehydrogenase family)